MWKDMFAFILQLQIEMLKFEKRLPPAEKKKDEE